MAHLEILFENEGLTVRLIDHDQVIDSATSSERCSSFLVDDKALQSTICLLKGLLVKVAPRMWRSLPAVVVLPSDEACNLILDGPKTGRKRRNRFQKAVNDALYGLPGDISTHEYVEMANAPDADSVKAFVAVSYRMTRERIRRLVSACGVKIRRIIPYPMYLFSLAPKDRPVVAVYQGISKSLCEVTLLKQGVPVDRRYLYSHTVLPDVILHVTGGLLESNGINNGNLSQICFLVPLDNHRWFRPAFNSISESGSTVLDANERCMPSERTNSLKTCARWAACLVVTIAIAGQAMAAAQWRNKALREVSRIHEKARMASYLMSQAQSHRSSTGQQGSENLRPFAWASVHNHLSGISRGISLEAVRLSAVQSQNGDSARHLVISGKGGLSEVLAFASRLQSGPIRWSGLSSLVESQGQYHFEVMVGWVP